MPEPLLQFNEAMADKMQGTFRRSDDAQNKKVPLRAEKAEIPGCDIGMITHLPGNLSHLIDCRLGDAPLLMGIVQDEGDGTGRHPRFFRYIF